MQQRSRKKRFIHRGMRYCAVIVERPFREGREVTLEVEGKKIHLAEFGFGDKALIEKLKSEIDKMRGLIALDRIT